MAMMTAAGPLLVIFDSPFHTDCRCCWRFATRPRNRSVIGTKDTSSGSRIRSVRMMTPMPRLAVTAISWITGTRISRIVMKPTRFASSATIAGRNSSRNVRRAASTQSQPDSAASETALIFCTPWLVPIAKMMNGTRMPSGSTP